MAASPQTSLDTKALDELAQAGIYTQLDSLLRARNWAKEIKLFARQPAKSMLLGEAKSRFRGRGMEFEEVRIYQPGDDIRSIDWRVSARTQVTHTKLFCEERERPVHILVDQRSTMFFGSRQRFKSVLAAEIAAGLAWAALAGSDRIGGQVIGDQTESDVRGRRTKQAVLQFIHDLHELNRRLPGQSNRIKTNMTAMLEEALRITRPGTAIFVISDFNDFSEASAKILSKLGRHTDISLIRIEDPLEQQLPKASQLPVSDGIERRTFSLSERLRADYQDSIERRTQTLIDGAARARAVVTRVTTEDSPRTFLNRLFS